MQTNFHITVITVYSAEKKLFLYCFLKYWWGFALNTETTFKRCPLKHVFLIVETSLNIPMKESILSKDTSRWCPSHYYK